MHSHSRFTTAGNKRWIAIAWPSIVFMTFLILVILTAMASVGCWRASSDKSGASRLPSTARQVAAPRQVLGAGSCSGSGCHSSSVEGHPAWQSSYTVWAKEDRHTRAYRVLFEPAAARIIAALSSGDPSAQKLGGTAVAAHLNKACLGCHSTDRGPTVSQGVGCESCHGPAGDWLVPHTGKNWRTAGNSLGMVDLADPFACATQCSLCHVGGPPCEDGSLREVSHDLIAAGHPRLAFDLRSFKQSEPPHWRDRFMIGDLAAGSPVPANAIDPVGEWALGRLGTLQAYLNQVALQSAQAQTDPRAQAPAAGAGVWPELTAFDCYGCHRLPIASARQPLRASPRLDPWHWALVDVILPPKERECMADFQTRVQTQWWIAPEPLATKACSQTLQDARSELPARMAAAPTGSLARTVVESADLTNWAEAAAVYAAFDALSDRLASTPSAAGTHGPLRKQLAEQLGVLHRFLEFPSQSPVESSEQAPNEPAQGAQTQFDSPHTFDPQAVAEVCERIALLLESADATGPPTP